MHRVSDRDPVNLRHSVDWTVLTVCRPSDVHRARKRIEKRKKKNLLPLEKLIVLRLSETSRRELKGPIGAEPQTARHPTAFTQQGVHSVPSGEQQLRRWTPSEDYGGKNEGTLSD